MNCSKVAWLWSKSDFMYAIIHMQNSEMCGKKIEATTHNIIDNKNHVIL